MYLGTDYPSKKDAHVTRRSELSSSQILQELQVHNQEAEQRSLCLHGYSSQARQKL